MLLVAATCQASMRKNIKLQETGLDGRTLKTLVSKLKHEQSVKHERNIKGDNSS